LEPSSYTVYSTSKQSEEPLTLRVQRLLGAGGGLILIVGGRVYSRVSLVKTLINEARLIALYASTYGFPLQGVKHEALESLYVKRLKPSASELEELVQALPDMASRLNVKLLILDSPIATTYALLEAVEGRVIAKNRINTLASVLHALTKRLKLVAVITMPIGSNALNVLLRYGDEVLRLNEDRLK